MNLAAIPANDVAPNTKVHKYRNQVYKAICF